MNVEFVECWQPKDSTLVKTQVSRSSWPLLTFADILKICTSLNLQTVGVWENYQKSAFQAKSSDALLILAQKTE